MAGCALGHPGVTNQPKRIGRPPLPPEQRRGATPTRTIRLDDARWAKLRRLRRLDSEWLERQIDQAPDPDDRG